MTISTDSEFYRYRIALSDFETALRYLEDASKLEWGECAHEALLSMAVICYWRPFSPNEKNPQAKAKSSLSIDDIINMSEVEKQTHDFCKSARNKMIAHAEFTFNPVQLTDNGTVWSKQSSVYDAVHQFSVDLDRLSCLLTRLREQCLRKIGSYATSRHRP